MRLLVKIIMKKKYSLLLFTVFFSSFAWAQFGSDEQISQLTSNLKAQNRADKMVEIGQKFLGLPYLASTLESPQEKLICRLDGFDCYTYVETLLALTLLSEKSDKSLAAFQNQMQELRYRNGKINGYGSRIHYFFEWAKHAEKLGYVKDMTPILGQKKPLSINFMSTHRQYYPAFKTDEAVLKDIKTMEDGLKSMTFFEIKKENLKEQAAKIKTGDIIAYTSNVAGLDVNHEGIAFWKNGQLHFMHASSEEKKIVISSETIDQYIQRIKKHSGLMVLRLI